MFKVVQKQQTFLMLQVIHYLRIRLYWAMKGEIKGVSHGGYEELVGTKRGQPHIANSMSKEIAGFGGCL